eukprot:CAMPEP_0182944900 /NCGR_PEP_ID=MMETSP0105_2-20130417/54706_1 /TAXON_ID=81532 ORGANISM="Acanthoeca-like sp., Strain 10tr" /NCGR_SAMPLE_ID=MMETSP0105_2 /ASSEMBLY_ACC=CAM_ASM_000205 /LENGTH=60 /DNA_ID=CAMNT_0025084869 /DNA_START=1 /DNA_END=179 /DNA_ORIENTATION=+
MDGQTASGRRFEAFNTALILVNVACFFASTVPAVARSGAADEGRGFLWIIEAATVGVFTG